MLWLVWHHFRRCDADVRPHVQLSERRAAEAAGGSNTTHTSSSGAEMKLRLMFPTLTHKENITNTLRVKHLFIRHWNKHGTPLWEQAASAVVRLRWRVGTGWGEGGWGWVRMEGGLLGVWGSRSAGSSCGGWGRRCWGGVGFGARSRSWSRVRDDEAAPLVPLHVPHTSDWLDLRRRGLPVVPVLEVSSLEDELAPPVAGEHVADPSEGRRQKTGSDWVQICS